MRDFYNSNKDFRDYVDRYCRKYTEGKSIPVEEALQHAKVRCAEKYYRELEEAALKQMGE